MDSQPPKQDKFDKLVTWIVFLLLGAIIGGWLAFNTMVKAIQINTTPTPALSGVIIGDN